ncbi:MAG: hypothetical protein K0T53_03005, partial [Wolbachia pipientis]|nr:hypothetical protein [Wolbachia pipientis]
VDVPSDNGCSPFENIDKGENASISERSSPQDTQLKKQSYQYWRHHDQHKYYLAINNKNFEQATNNSISQNIKNNNLHTIVVSILATAGIALGVSTAVQLEISTVRIAIGACCLVAAAAMYYSMPKSLVENSKVEEVSKKWLTTVIP